MSSSTADHVDEEKFFLISVSFISRLRPDWRIVHRSKWRSLVAEESSASEFKVFSARAVALPDLGTGRFQGN